MSFDQITVGLTTFPIPTGLGKAPLANLDPTIFHLMGFFAQVADRMLLDAFLEACAATTPPVLLAKPNQFFQNTFPHSIVEYLDQTNTKFPAMAMTRLASEDQTIQIGQSVTRSELELMIVLPPLTIGQRRALDPFLQAASKVFNASALYGHEQTYQSGQRLFDLAGIERLTVSTSSYTSLPGVSADLAFPIVSIRFSVDEKVSYENTDNPPAFGDLRIDYALEDIEEDLPFIEQEISL